MEVSNPRRAPDVPPKRLCSVCGGAGWLWYLDRDSYGRYVRCEGCGGLGEIKIEEGHEH